MWRASNRGLGRAFFRRPRGFIDEPIAGRAHERRPLRFRGWCLFPGSATTRVELRVGDRPAELARLAIERQDVAALTDHPSAPICGFEHTVDLGELDSTSTRVTVEATAYSADGRTLELEPMTIELEPPAPDVAAWAPAAAVRALRRAPHPGAPLRLLAYTHSLAHDGGSLYLVELVRRWVEAERFSCSVVTLADGPLRAELEELDVPVHVTDAGAAGSPTRYEGHLAELHAWAAPQRFDAAFVNTLASFAGAELAQRLGIPAVWAVHESYTLPMFWHVAYPPDAPPCVCERAAQVMRASAAVVFEAEATRRLFLTEADPARLLAVPYGIELEALATARRAIDPEAIRRRLKIDAGTQVVLSLGSIEHRKSQAMLAQAFGLIADGHPGARLVMVGETGDPQRAGYEDALRMFVRRTGLASRVTIEPTTADPYSWHAVADLLVCASDLESLPRVILEAMAFGTPVLSTKTFGVPELVDDGRTGWLCDTRDVQALADGLERALGASEAEREAVSRAAAEHVNAYHDQADYSERIGRLLHGLALDPTAPPRALLARSEPAAEIAR